MKRYLKPSLIICLNFLFFTARAQSFDRTVNDGTEAVKAVKGLFKKKKTAKDSTAIASGATAPSKTGAGGMTDIKPFSGPTGRLYLAEPNTQGAKVIDCDELGPFDDGAAIIRKGTSYALIDSAGNFIIPFNKYRFIKYTSNTWENGIFVATVISNGTDNNGEVYINAHGKLLYDNAHTRQQVGMSQDYRMIVVTSPSSKAVTALLIDRNGKRYTIPEDAIVSDGMVIIPKGVGSKRAISFKSLDGPLISKPEFEELYPFYDGVAEFMIKTQYGETKYGLVDEKGKIIVPPTYASLGDDNGATSSPSSRLAVGLAVAYSGDKEFINRKTGKVIFKQSKQDRYGNVGFRLDGDNYLYTQGMQPTNFLIDSDGNKIAVNDFLKNIGVTIGPNQKFKYATVLEQTSQNPCLYFHLLPTQRDDEHIFTCVYNTITHSAVIGTFAPPSNASLNRKFTQLAPQIQFDPVAHLVLVEYSMGRTDNFSPPKFLTGYMNDKGKLVLIKASN